MLSNPLRTFTPKQDADYWSRLDKRVSSAGVWCETVDGRLLVIKNNYKRYWSIPGGIIDKGETPKEAAIREVHEEVGITLDPDNVEFSLIIDRRSEKRGHSYQFVFRAAISDEMIHAIRLQASEVDEYELVGQTEILADSVDSGRLYGKVIHHWAKHHTGYSEQEFPRFS